MPQIIIFDQPYLSTITINATVQAEIFARRKFSPISPPALIGEIFYPRMFCPVLMYCIGENLFHRKFLQYKGIWVWRNFCLAKIFGYTVCAVCTGTGSIEVRVVSHKLGQYGIVAQPHPQRPGDEANHSYVTCYCACSTHGVCALESSTFFIFRIIEQQISPPPRNDAYVCPPCASKTRLLVAKIS